VLIWTKGNHTVKIGGDVQQLEAITPLGFNGSDNYGTYQFNTNGSAGLFTGVDFADFLLGTPYQTFYDVVQQDNDGISQHYHFLRPGRMAGHASVDTLYGLRYELHPATMTSTATLATSTPA